MKTALLSLALCGLTNAQVLLSDAIVITNAAQGARSVYATDLDGDGDADVLSASQYDHKIAWHENLGAGEFGAQRVIAQTSTAPGASFVCVYAVDLDGDGDSDVLSASETEDQIAWYENLGGGSFGAQQVITNGADGAWSVYATDLDGDGDADVLSASVSDDTIAWYQNLGGGSFGPQAAITTNAITARCVYAADLDNDGDADVLSASRGDDKIAWYENQGAGAFGPPQAITTGSEADGAQGVYAADLDGDGDTDVLSASYIDDKIAWYENLGDGAFGPQQVITTDADEAISVYAVDLDGDGDADVLSASLLDDTVAWYENLGGGSFGAQQIITNGSDADGPVSIYATDVDGDGDTDVLAASLWDNRITWFKNHCAGVPGEFSTFGVGCAGTGGIPVLDTANGQAPTLSSVLQLELSSLPQSILASPFGVLGFSSTSNGSTPLPADASSIGMNGCTLYCSHNIVYPIANLGGSATWDIQIPSDETLCGRSLYFQGFIIDLLANPLGLTVTNAGHGLIGIP